MWNSKGLGQKGFETKKGGKISVEFKRKQHKCEMKTGGDKKVGILCMRQY